ncbi:MAG: BON domain-containing protein [Planctomycetota bacterium]|nr:BON domain-containing protein [Planctomycetota bacterium]
MRRFFLGLAISSLTASAPVVALGGDREIADNIISTLKSHQSDGSLKGFDIDLSVEAGLVTLTGSVSNAAQAQAVLDAAKSASGVTTIVNQISVKEATSASKTASTLAFAAQSLDADNAVQQASSSEESASADANADEATSFEPPKMADDQSSVSQSDAAITEAALSKLGKDKASGFLRNFNLDLSTVGGEVWVRGYVANAEQKQRVLQTMQYIPGVTRVVDDITISGNDSRGMVQPASTSQATPTPPSVASMPTMGQAASAGPRAFAPSMVANYQSDTPIPGIPIAAPEGGMMMGGGQTPMPMNMGPSHGGGVPRYDQPQMPGYAWPSYAAYPNYSAVTYPKQYSASAWPYIGPFYPYPQVPLGWRRVALEWDDGLWYLDFTSK